MEAGIVEVAPKPPKPEQRVKEVESPDQQVHDEGSESPTATLAKIHYMPHHPVIRGERETTKVRTVYDGSAKPSANELSINDCLQPSPNFIPKLFDVLIKFRSHSVALTGDIEKAFLRIGITETDRDMLRFLWLKDPHELNSELVQLRFTRLAFGLRPSPSILGATISHHLHKHREIYPKLVHAIEGSLYVDDLLTREDDDDRAFEVYENSKKLMSQGRFNLRKWNSNSPTLLAKIKEAEGQTAPVESSNPSAVATVSEEDESYAKATTSSNSTIAEENESYTKLLGIIWDSQSDQFTFDFSELITYISKLPVTKRSLLKFTAKIFDPLGFLSPFVVRLKMMFQVLCTDKLSWDNPIQGDMLKTWNSIVSEIKALNGIKIPRCYFQERSATTKIQLHAFSDASEKAYATAVYVQSTHSDGHVETRLIALKTRVAPIKTLTIPRLELLGAVINSRLVDTIQRSLQVPVDQVVYWVDSKVVLCWIQNEKPWKQYVPHRVDEIRRLTEKDAWKHCPGVLNPADLPSRGLPASELTNSQLWWNGPPFLQDSEDRWPQEEITDTGEIAMSEIMKNPPEVVHVLTSQLNPASLSVNLSEIIKCEEFSTYNSFLRVTAYVLRFITNVKSKILKQRPETREVYKEQTQLSADEIHEAETYWIRTVQAKSFVSEINFLQVGNQSKPFKWNNFPCMSTKTKC